MVTRRSDGILSAFRIEAGPEPRITFRGRAGGACTASAAYEALPDLIAHFWSPPPTSPRRLTGLCQTRRIR
ncbi:hypothetical protein [Actinoplanes sp. CA-252034]|uniref:hypothetical protein n=1 Tax=Actinoplanes sp. CA-252034 TaxID=3239906 RepID=UPI003D9839C5